MAPHFLCTFPPCPHTVDCYVSRPTEKTVFLIFYFTIGLLSALFSAAELIYLLWKVDQNDEKHGSCLESLLHPDEPRTQHRNSQGKRCSGRSKVSSARVRPDPKIGSVAGEGTSDPEPHHHGSSGGRSQKWLPKDTQDPTRAEDPQWACARAPQN